MELRDALTLGAILVGSGGIFGGIYALLKLRPEAGQITVTTAQGVLLMQSDVIKAMRARELEMQARIDMLEAENLALNHKVAMLEQKISAVESRVTVEEHRTTDIEAQANKDREDRQ